MRQGRRSAIISQRQNAADGKKSLNAAYDLQDADVATGEFLCVGREERGNTKRQKSEGTTNF